MPARKKPDNSLTHIFKVKSFIFLHKVCKYLHVSVYFQNRYGIKAFNKPLFDNIKISAEKVIEIDCNHLFLGFDALKDEYTLTEIPLKESPHYELVSRLYRDSKNFEECDYVYREKLGYLDGRMGQIITSRTLDMHRNVFAKSLQYIKQGYYKEVLVYEISGKYYLFDGKHRAALCAVLDVPIKCSIMEIELLKKDSYANKVYGKMKNNFYTYKKNIKLLDAIGIGK